MSNTAGTSPGLLPAYSGGWPLLPIAFSLLLLSLALLLAATARFPSTGATIAGDSMAPGLQGQHYRAECRQCGFPLECGLQHPPDRGLAFCPNCGFRENPVGPTNLQPADLVRIVPLRMAGRIERWDRIAFRSPVDGSLVVKRVAAMPGERPAIAGGELVVDGKIIAKTLPQLRQLAILVHDDAYRPAAESQAPHWQPLSESSFRYDASGVATLRGTIEYQHQTISATTAPPLRSSDEPAPIRDLDSYNQSLARKLFSMSDLLLQGEFRLAAGQSASVQLLLSQDAEFRLTIADGKAAALTRSGRQEQRLPLPCPATDRWHRFTLARCDGRFLLELDDYRLAGDIQATLSPDEPPRFRVTASNAALRRLQVWRDVYYLNPQLGNRAWQLDRPLADDEYFVLGDNPPASTDSRHWQTGIRRADVLGKVVSASE